MLSFRTIALLTALSSLSSCLSMEHSAPIQKFKSMSLEEFEKKIPRKGFIKFKEDRYKNLNAEFKKIWGYYIPDTVVKETTLDGKSTYKLVPEAYLKNKKENIIYEIQRTCNFPKPLPIKTNSVTVNVSQANSFYTEKELNEKIKIKEEAINNLRQENIKIEHQIAAINNSKKSQRPIMYEHMTCDQKKYALKSLIDEYNVRSAAFLLRKIKYECTSNNGDTLNGFVDQDISWQYIREDNKLVFKRMQSDSSESSSD